MPTLNDYLTELTRKIPGDIIRKEAIASLTTTTIVSSALAVGGWSNDRFAGQHLWRPDTTTTADKVRYCTQYASSTGTLTHAGSNFSDTTATGENVIVSRIEPYIVRQAIDSAIRRLRTIDRTEVPFVNGQGWYSLGDLDWIRHPNDIVRITWDRSPQISRNRYLQKRNSVNSSGVFLPDYWEISSNAAVTPFLNTNYRGQKYRYSLERSGGTDATMTQVVSANLTGVSADFPVGETITAVVVADPDASGDVLVSISDGTTTNTDSGSGTARQEITDSITLAAAASEITMVVTAQTNNNPQTIFESYALVGTLTDEVRRDNFPEYPIAREDWDFDQNGVLTIKVPNQGRGRFLIYSKRPYPGFDATRLLSGAADADSSDAPVDAVVAGALSRIFEGMEGTQSPNYIRWENEFSALARKHIFGFENNANSRVNSTLAPAVRRVR